MRESRIAASRAPARSWIGYMAGRPTWARQASWIFQRMATVSLPDRQPQRRILLADADAFFVAVARLVDPEGAGKTPLLIVGGSHESRGVVCSASYETRKFGVRSAMPISRALQLYPDALCVPVPSKACGEMSRRIRKVLELYAPAV